MSAETIQPQPGRRPVYPVDSDAEARPSSTPPVAKPQSPLGRQPAGTEDPASDANTESANHPNDDE
jgi:hypothetical protein